MQALALYANRCELPVRYLQACASLTAVADCSSHGDNLLGQYGVCCPCCETHTSQYWTVSCVVLRAAVIVSNHVSYLDILVHMSHSAPSFVARGNTQDLPLIGVVRCDPHYAL